MRISIQTLGTRGDVQPFLALARGLTARGASVRLLASRDFTADIESAGITPDPPFAFSMREWMAEMEDLSATRNPIGIVRFWLRRGPLMAREILEKGFSSARDADVVVAHPKATGALSGAEAAGAAFIIAALQPLLDPTAAFPFPGFAAKDRGPAANRRSYWPLRVAMLPRRGKTNRLRAEHGLAPLGAAMLPTSLYGRPIPRLVAASRALFDRPADWPEDAHLTGAWFLDGPETEVSPRLERFLSAGPPPVYVGFGSMPVRDPSRIGAAVVGGLRRAGVRGVVNAGWARLTESDPGEDMLFIDDAPHGALFPRCAAVMHHGGAGVTHAGLRAGRPQIVAPHLIDQPWHAERLRERGLAPQPLSPRRLTEETIGAAVAEVLSDPRFAERASEAAPIVAQEDGVAAACAVIAAVADRRQSVAAHSCSASQQSEAGGIA